MKNIKNMLQRTLIFIVFTIILAGSSQAQVKWSVLTTNGTWCWFSDPRAIYIPGDTGQIMTGYVTSEGDIAAMLYNLKTKRVQQSILNRNLEIDDHDNPAFLQLPDSSLFAFYTKHHNDVLLANRGKLRKDIMYWQNADTLNPNGKADLKKFGDDRYTYANPCMLSGENNRIYLFGRWIGFKPNMTWSDDGGNTWANGRVMIAQKPYRWSQRPYVKYFCDGKDKIHIVFTDGHPRDEATNSVYYVCYTKGAFYRADGKKICTIKQLPLQPKKATLVYDGKKTKERAWIFDIIADSLGHPAIAFTRYPSEKEHIYHYTWFDGEKWNDEEVCHGGKWFPKTPEGETEREPHYSGGMSIDPNHPHTLYVSREVGSVFEIEKRVFNPTSKNWTIATITRNSQTNNVRPYVVKNTPEGEGTILLWLMANKYIHYTDFKTAVKLYVDND